MEDNTRRMLNSLVKKYPDNKEKALVVIRERTIEALVNWLDGGIRNESDLFDLLKDMEPCLHRMDELDEVFYYFKPTEVLKNLGDWDLGCDYFNEDTMEYGDELWDVSGVDIYDVADRLYEDHEDFYELDPIFEEESEMIGYLNHRYDLYNQAKELFDLAMDNDPNEVMAVLWNINQN